MGVRLTGRGWAEAQEVDMAVLTVGDMRSLADLLREMAVVAEDETIEVAHRLAVTDGDRA